MLEQSFHAVPTTAPSGFFLAPTRLSDWTPCNDSKFHALHYTATTINVVGLLQGCKIHWSGCWDPLGP
jgi:hypothetical protein